MEELAGNFWNIRGVFKVAGLIDLGTQMSLVQKDDGRFIVIDSYAPSEPDRNELRKLTADGEAIDAIINVHPFHTIHCRAIHEFAPKARLFGTRRHRQKAPDLPWMDQLIEEPSTQHIFAEDLEFAVPDGVDFVCPDENVHVASVLVRHRSSGIVHVDDTLNVIAAPGWLGRLLPQSRLKFHPLLSRALREEPGAADAFEEWARKIADRWATTSIVCAAHSTVRHLPPDGWRREVLAALAGVEGKLAAHRARHG